MLQLAKILRNVPDDDDYKVTTRTVVQACGKNKNHGNTSYKIMTYVTKLWLLILNYLQNSWSWIF